MYSGLRTALCGERTSRQVIDADDAKEAKELEAPAAAAVSSAAAAPAAPATEESEELEWCPRRTCRALRSCIAAVGSLYMCGDRCSRLTPHRYLKELHRNYR